MIVEVKVPEVGESITEGIITAWLKKDGEVVRAGEAIYELETDKVTMDVPADVGGQLSVLVAEGETVNVGQVVAKIDIDVAAQPEPITPQVDVPPEPVKKVEAPAPKPDVGDGPPISAPAGLSQAAEKVKRDMVPPLAPAVRRLVAEHGLDPTAIPGSGRAGQVTKSDVLTHLQKPSPPQAIRPAQVPATIVVEQEIERETRVKMSPLRHRIAERLVQVQQNAAILTTFNEVDMSKVMAFRARHKDKFEKKFDTRLGFMSFFVKAAVDALKTVPQINARLDGDDIVYQHFYDIGVAVSTDKGLIVPIIREADKLSFAAVERRIVDLATRGRDRKLTLDELTGGCFTISNGGIYGSMLSTPILNPPQSGILGMHRIQKRPVVVDDDIVIRPMMFLALSYDHRIVDGSQSVTFLKRIVECIEDPERMLLEV